jgi:hypothetical protein
LNHSDGEAERFYKELKQRGASVRVGLEATGYSRWFERLLAELGIEVWIGDAAEITRDSEAASRKPTARTADSCCGCFWRIAFLESGHRIRRIGICGNCFGTGIGSCRCGRGS